MHRYCYSSTKIFSMEFECHAKSFSNSLFRMYTVVDCELLWISSEDMLGLLSRSVKVSVSSNVVSLKVVTVKHCSVPWVLPD